MLWVLWAVLGIQKKAKKLQAVDNVERKENSTRNDE
jgi:hypothetical protein